MKTNELDANSFNPEEWINVTSLAKLLGLSKASVSRRLRRKGAPKTVRSGVCLYIHRKDINSPVLLLK